MILTPQEAGLELRGDELILEYAESWFGRGIAWFTRGACEPDTWVSHSGRMVDPLNVAEALRRFTIHPLDCNRNIQVWQYQPGFPSDDKQCLVERAEYHAGRKYGWWWLIPQAADGLLGKILPVRQVNLFRRVIPAHAKNTICSLEVASAYHDCADLDFGIAPRAATPDDIADFVELDPNWLLLYDNSPAERRRQRKGIAA